jgi:spore germination cell wall hydrolase CwlJ-like protein
MFTPTPIPSLMATPVPDPSKPFEQQDPLTLLAMCVWGEARGVNNAAKSAVACVVRNRVGYAGKYGRGFPGVILKPWQFSSFNSNDPNRAKLLYPVKEEGQRVWEACYQAAEEVYWGKTTDPTGNAVFYYSAPLTGPPTAWGDVTWTCVIDGLHFYREASKNTGIIEAKLPVTSPVL